MHAGAAWSPYLPEDAFKPTWPVGTICWSCKGELADGARSSLSVFNAGSSIAFSFRHECTTDRQITVSKVNLALMLKPLDEPVRAAFLTAATTFYEGKVKKKQLADAAKAVVAAAAAAASTKK